eukprot:gene71-440_t
MTGSTGNADGDGDVIKLDDGDESEANTVQQQLVPLLASDSSDGRQHPQHHRLLSSSHALLDSHLIKFEEERKKISLRDRACHLISVHRLSLSSSSVFRLSEASWTTSPRCDKDHRVDHELIAFNRALDDESSLIQAPEWISDPSPSVVYCACGKRCALRQTLIPDTENFRYFMWCCAEKKCMTWETRAVIRHTDFPTVCDAPIDRTLIADSNDLSEDKVPKCSCGHPAQLRFYNDLQERHFGHEKFLANVESFFWCCADTAQQPCAFRQMKMEVISSCPEMLKMDPEKISPEEYETANFADVKPADFWFAVWDRFVPVSDDVTEMFRSLSLLSDRICECDLTCCLVACKASGDYYYGCPREKCCVLDFGFVRPAAAVFDLGVYRKIGQVCIDRYTTWTFIMRWAGYSFSKSCIMNLIARGNRHPDQWPAGSYELSEGQEYHTFVSYRGASGFLWLYLACCGMLNMLPALILLVVVFPILAIILWAAFENPCVDGYRVFMDKYCIFQGTTTEKQGSGILRLPLYLQSSQELVALFDSAYSTRLWCIWEIAVYLRLRKDPKIRFVSLSQKSLEAFIIGFALFAIGLSKLFYDLKALGPLKSQETALLLRLVHDLFSADPSSEGRNNPETDGLRAFDMFVRKTVPRHLPTRGFRSWALFSYKAAVIISATYLLTTMDLFAYRRPEGVPGSVFRPDRGSPNRDTWQTLVPFDRLKLWFGDVPKGIGSIVSLLFVVFVYHPFQWYTLGLEVKGLLYLQNKSGLSYVWSVCVVLPFFLFWESILSWRFNLFRFLEELAVFGIMGKQLPCYEVTYRFPRNFCATYNGWYPNVQYTFWPFAGITELLNVFDVTQRTNPDEPNYVSGWRVEFVWEASWMAPLVWCFLIIPCTILIWAVYEPFWAKELRSKIYRKCFAAGGATQKFADATTSSEEKIFK